MKLLILIAMVVLMSSSMVLSQDICESDFDCNGAVDADDVGTFLEDFGRSQFFNPCPPCVPPVLIPRTGQTSCYDELGNVMNCTGTGQDGEYQIGYERFTDNGDGTVTDNYTELMWTKDVNIFGDMNWLDSLTSCNNFDYATYNDWRLPNIYELKALAEAFPLTDHFTNWTRNIRYWSSTTYAEPTHTFEAWFVYTYDGDTYLEAKDGHGYAVCVRGGH